MIAAEGLTKRFGAYTAVDGVSFEVGAGEILALLGPNGAGKTTIIRMLSALLMPTEGRAMVAGHDTRVAPIEVHRAVGLLTEAPGLYLRMGAHAYVEFFGQLHGVPRHTLKSRIEDLFLRFGLWEHRDKALYTFSKGMRQKAALVRALVQDPPVVFLDEPTSALDPASAKSVRDYVRELRERARAVVVCTHNLVEAEALADRIAIIRAGQMIAFGTPSELRRRLGAAACFEVRLRSEAAPYAAALNGRVRQLVSEGPLLRFATDDPERHNPSAIAALVRAGAEIISVRELGHSLEAVYLGIVQEGDPTTVEGSLPAREAPA